MGNYEKIADIIGVDFEEQSGISGVENKTFYIDKVKGLLCVENPDFITDSLCVALLSARKTIIRAKFIPTYGDIYYSYSNSDDRDIIRLTWRDTIVDYALFRADIVFQSYRDAEREYENSFDNLQYNYNSF